MGRRAFIVSIFPLLGFVISVFANPEPSEEIDADQDLNAESLPVLLQNRFRVVRSSGKGPKKKSNNIGRKKLKGKAKKGHKRRGDKKFKRKRKNGTRKKSKQETKRKRVGRMNGNWYRQKERERKRKQPSKELRQACDEKELCKRIKLYNKYTNQERKAKRILRSCKTMKSKAAKAKTAFKISSEAIQESGDTEVESIKGTLADCEKTAAAACALTNVAQCAEAEQTKITGCVTKLRAWIDAFGPGPSSCLGQENCCACINAISPVVPDECLTYDAIDQTATEKKLKCTKNKDKGGDEGSFGECRKQQYLSSSKGNEHFKKCKGTTAKSGRRMLEILASRLFRK